MEKVTLAGRVIVITGGGNGLGKAYALEAARRGARVVVNDRGGAVNGEGASDSPALAVEREIRGAGGVAVASFGDVTTEEGRLEIVQTAIDAFGRIDGLVCNAGILRDRAFHNMAAEAIDAVLDVHLRGHIHLAKLVYTIMRAAEYGRIVFVTSASGLYGSFGQANYGAAKAAMAGLTRVLALEGAPKGIMVNAIAPIAATRMTENVLDDRAATLMAPDSVAQMVALLVSDECPVTGKIYSVSGGRIAEIFIAETEGVVFDDVTAEFILDLLPVIALRRDFLEPVSLPDAINIIQNDLQAAAGI